MSTIFNLCSFPFSSLWGGVPPSLLYPSHDDGTLDDTKKKPLHLTLEYNCSESDKTQVNINHDPSLSSHLAKREKKRKNPILRPIPSDVIVLSDSDESENNASMPHEAVVMCYGIKLLESDLLTLRPGNWLNDQVINSYMRLILAYNRRDIYITNTFFYTKLKRSGFQGVNKWLKNVNVSRLSKILVPVHTGNHWSLAHISIKELKIEYYDSLGHRNTSCMKTLKLFLMKMLHHFKIKLPTPSRYQSSYPKNIPRQTNGSDCGVFVCQYARWLSFGDGQTIKWSSNCPFSSKEMIKLRHHMTQEIRKQELIPLSDN